MQKESSFDFDFYYKPHVWQNFSSGVIAQNALDQSDYRIL